MKKKILSLVAVVLVTISVSTFAEDAIADSGNFKPLVELAEERRTRHLSDLSASELQLFVYEREILRRFLAGDIDQTMDLFLTEDAIVCPPNNEAVIGREPQKVMFKEWLGMKGVVLDWEPIDVYVGPSDDMGYVYGLVRWKNPNEPQHLGKYISVWVKENGKWKNKVEIRNLIEVEK